jgi:hypothetical protein
MFSQLFVILLCLGEIAENFQEIVTNKFGVRVVKYLMAARHTTLSFARSLTLIQHERGGIYNPEKWHGLSYNFVLQP